MGRPRKPTAILKAQGTYRPDRHGKGEEPQPDGEPIMPNWLDKTARQLWRRVVPNLIAMGVAKAVDAEALAGMCRWYAIWRAADAKLQAGDGDTYKLTIEATTAWKNYAAIANKFGLNPTDRTKLSIETDNEPDELMEFLRMRP